MDFDSIHEQLKAEAVGTGNSPEQADFYVAVSRVLNASKQYRKYAPVKDAHVQEYHSAMQEYDDAWDALDSAAAKVAKRIS